MPWWPSAVYSPSLAKAVTALVAVVARRLLLRQVRLRLLLRRHRLRQRQLPRRPRLHRRLHRLSHRRP